MNATSGETPVKVVISKETNNGYKEIVNTSHQGKSKAYDISGFINKFVKNQDEIDDYNDKISTADGQNEVYLAAVTGNTNVTTNLGKIADNEDKIRKWEDKITKLESEPNKVQATAYYEIDKDGSRQPSLFTYCKEGLSSGACKKD